MRDPAAALSAHPRNRHFEGVQFALGGDVARADGEPALQADGERQFLILEDNRPAVG